MTDQEVKRYNLVVPQTLFDEVQKIALERHTAVIEVLKQFIRLGLVVDKVEKSPEASLIIREGDKERELVLL